MGIGAAIGTALEEACLNESALTCSIENGLVWAAIGALIDCFHKGLTTVYADGRRKGVLVTWREQP